MEFFVNLMPGTPDILTRSSSVGAKPVKIAKGIQVDTPIQLVETEQGVYVIPSDGSTETPFSENLKGNSDEPILWIATPNFEIFSDAKYQLRFFAIDGGFVVALRKGEMRFPVAGAGDEVTYAPFSRGVEGGSDDMDKVITPETMAGFNRQKDLFRNNRVYDVDYRELVFMGNSKIGDRVDTVFKPSIDSFNINEAGVAQFIADEAQAAIDAKNAEQAAKDALKAEREAKEFNRQTETLASGASQFMAHLAGLK